jgi:hypothetical protein
LFSSTAFGFVTNAVPLFARSPSNLGEVDMVIAYHAV